MSSSLRYANMLDARAVAGNPRAVMDRQAYIDASRKSGTNATSATQAAMVALVAKNVAGPVVPGGSVLSSAIGAPSGGLSGDDSDSESASTAGSSFLMQQQKLASQKQMSSNVMKKHQDVQSNIASNLRG